MSVIATTNSGAAAAAPPKVSLPAGVTLNDVTKCYDYYADKNISDKNWGDFKLKVTTSICPAPK